MPDPGEDYQRWSTIAANNGNIDSLIDWHEGQTRRSVNDSSRSELAAHAKNRNLNNGSIVTTGTANAQAFLSGVTYITLPVGLRATLKVGSGLDNTGAMTLNCDGTGAVAVKRGDLTECIGGEFVGNCYVDLIYNGTFWIYLYSASRFAPINSPVFTGDPKVPTPPDPLDSDTSIANTAWVQNLVYGGQGIVLSQQVFSTPGTFTYIPHPAMKSCIIECVGGGGAGGGGDGQAGVNFGFSGGGSGGYSRKHVTAAVIGGGRAIIVGAGGVGINGVGGNGGDTQVCGAGTTDFALCLVGAHGGGGGPGRAGLTGGAGGAVGIGDVVAAGAPGHPGRTDPSGGVEQVAGGNGGSSIFGGGGVTPWVGGNVGVTGGAARGYGSGGGGAQASEWAAPTIGGNGSGGIVIITEFAGVGAPGATGPQGPIGPTGPSGPGTGDVLRSGTPTAGQFAKWTDTNHIQGVTISAPQRTVLTTAGSGTYTTPAGATWLDVEIVGGGGGGGAALSGNGGAGGNSTFGSIVGNGGNGGAANNGIGGTGGSASGGDINIAGGNGQGGQSNTSVAVALHGGQGGSSLFGGNGGGGIGAGVGTAAQANSGSGGGGGGGNVSQNSGGGGGAGAYCRKAIASPAASYSYAVGAAGAAGSGSGAAGAAGAAGIIIVTAYFGG